MSSILIISDGNGIDPNLFDNYGQLSAVEITVHTTTYFNRDTKQTQNDDQLYHCMKKSLSASGNAKIIAKSTKYYIGSNTCGDIFFKILLQKSTIDTRATASNMREKLSSLDTYIATVIYDNEKLN